MQKVEQKESVRVTVPDRHRERVSNNKHIHTAHTQRLLVSARGLQSTAPSIGCNNCSLKVYNMTDKLVLLLLIAGVSVINGQFDFDLKIKPFKNDFKKVFFQGITRGYGMPEFMQQMSSESRQEIWKLMKEREMSRRQKEDKIQQIIDNESKLVQDAYQTFKLEMERRKEEIGKIHSERVAKLSPEAQAIDRQIVELFKNDDMTPRERKEKLEMILNGQPKSVKKELKSLWKGCQGRREFMPPFKFWRPNGGPGGAGFMRRLRWKGRPVDNTNSGPEDVAPPLDPELEQLEKKEKADNQRVINVNEPVIEAASFRMSDDGYFVEV